VDTGGKWSPAYLVGVASACVLGLSAQQAALIDHCLQTHAALVPVGQVKDVAVWREAIAATVQDSDYRNNVLAALDALMHQY
jgi:hypothetical protein